MGSLLTLLENTEIQQLTVFTNAASGLRAFLVIDNITLGPANRSTRTWAIRLGERRARVRIEETMIPDHKRGNVCRSTSSPRTW